MFSLKMVKNENSINLNNVKYGDFKKYKLFYFNFLYFSSFTKVQINY